MCYQRHTEYREIPSAIVLGFKSGYPTVSIIDIGDQSILGCRAILCTVGYWASSLGSTPRIPIAPLPLVQPKMSPDFASVSWLRAHSLGNIPSWPLVIWAKPCPVYFADINLLIPQCTADRRGSRDAAKDSHQLLHLAQIILKNSLNLPLTYPYALYYVMYLPISISPCGNSYMIS